jgi:hypothetical protein
MIEGLRLTGGDASGLGGYPPPYPFNAGGGVYVGGGSGEMRRCWVFGNNAGSGTSEGGGIYLHDTTFRVEDCEIFENHAGHMGGGLSLRWASSTISGNVVLSNTASYGGGLHVQSSNVAIMHNVIQGNSASQNGGGMNMLWGGGRLEGNLVISNTASHFGGGMDLDRSPITSTGNTVWGNRVPAGFAGGGGMRLVNSDALLVNDIVAANACDEFGAGIYVLDCGPRFVHLTIADNHSGDGSGVHVSSRSGAAASAAFTNTIISGHTVGITVTLGNTVTLVSTLWHGNGSDWAGAGVIQHTLDFAGEPAFESPASGDYHLGAKSAAIDRGVVTWVAFDIDGDERLLGAAPDLGADEYVAAIPGRHVVYLPIIVRRN